MYLFLSDETNTTQTAVAQFLIYGAILVPLKSASQVAIEIEKIRLRAGYPPDAEFKFDTKSRPNGVTKEQFDRAKEQVLDLASTLGVKFLAFVIHHEICGKIEQQKRPLFALKTLLCEFDLFLSREMTSGLCVVDRFEIAHSILSKILIDGVNPSGDLGRFQRKLSNIWMYSVTSIGCSHLCSMCDIVLGAFRYSVNSTKAAQVARKLYPKIQKLFLHQSSDPTIIENWGLFLRPKRVQVPTYAKAYDALREHLKNLEQADAVSVTV